jgi:hypothetical protein
VVVLLSFHTTRASVAKQFPDVRKLDISEFNVLGVFDTAKNLRRLE